MWLQKILCKNDEIFKKTKLLQKPNTCSNGQGNELHELMSKSLYCETYCLALFRIWKKKKKVL